MSVSVLPQSDTVRFHLSLNVNDLGKTVKFLTALLGCPPKKWRADYAKFEPDELPLVLSLEPRANPQLPQRSTSGEGALNHVGIRMTEPAQLVDAQRRLEESGYTTHRSDGVECCYARQTKFWAFDDDHNMWEVYVLDEDLDHRGHPGSGAHSESEIEPASIPNSAGESQSWAHRLAEDFPESIPHTGQLDEILLQGTWNAKRHRTAWSAQLSAVRSALKPGGKLVLHLLTANQSMASLRELPGRASVVEVAPELTEVLAAVEAHGFVKLQLEKYAETPCFMQDGVELRETRLAAFAPQADPPGSELVRVVFKGPYAELLDDDAGRFIRGEAKSISAEVWQRLAGGPVADLFVKLAEPSSTSTRCGVS